MKNSSSPGAKAKVDLYYSTNPPLLEMAEYEDTLLDNLEKLRERINGEDQRWINDSDFLGTDLGSQGHHLLSTKKKARNR